MNSPQSAASPPATKCSSAGGTGIARFTPFLIRFLWGNGIDLTILNDSGPVTANLDDIDGILLRANEWQVGQFYPASCTACNDMGQPTAVIEWRLANDRTIREAFYSTDQDSVVRPSLGLPVDEFRDLMIAEVGLIAKVAGDLPVTADLEAGYGDPGGTVARAIDVGIVGANLEDQVKPLAVHEASTEAVDAATGRKRDPIWDDLLGGKAVDCMGPAGSAVLMNTGCAHAGSARATSRARRTIHHY